MSYRRTERRRRGFGWAACCAAALAGALSAAAAPLGKGDRFPDFAAYELEGKPLPATAGKVVIVDFWASWCGPCRDSFPVLNELKATYGSRGLVVIGVNVDDNAADMRKFLERVPADFAVTRDAGQKLVGACEIASMPTSFIVDHAGRVRAVHNGFFKDETEHELRDEIKALLDE